MSDCTEAASRIGSARAIATALMFVALPARSVRAQGVLSQASYDELRLSGLRVDVGSAATHDLRGAMIWGVHVDAGYLAPHVRVLLGVSRMHSHFTDRAVTRLNRRLLALVNDPDSNATIDVGAVGLSDVIADLDLQLMLNEGHPVTIALGLGAGLHLRSASGRAIDGTFLKDALDGMAPSLNGTLGLAVALAPAWRLTGELRGALLSDYSSSAARVGFEFRFPGGRRRS